MHGIQRDVAAAIRALDPRISEEAADDSMRAHLSAKGVHEQAISAQLAVLQKERY